MKGYSKDTFLTYESDDQQNETRIEKPRKIPILRTTQKMVRPSVKLWLMNYEFARTKFIAFSLVSG